MIPGRYHCVRLLLRFTVAHLSRVKINGKAALDKRAYPENKKEPTTMKTAYIIITDKIDLATMVQLMDAKYIDTFREITAEEAYLLKQMSCHAIERYKQTKAYKDGWSGTLFCYEDHKEEFGRLARYLRYQR